MITNPDGHNAGTLAMMDQAASVMRAEALRYAATAARLTARRGEVQGGADLTALFVSMLRTEPHLVAAVAAAACMELGKERQ